MPTTERKVLLELTAKEFRQLVFLSHVGAFIYQITNTHEQSDVAYRLLHKVGTAGDESGVPVLENGRLAGAIDIAVAKQVVAHNRDVMMKRKFWEEFEYGVNN